MRSWIGAARLAAALVLPFAFSVGASALDEAKDEKAQLEACEKDLCTPIGQALPALCAA